jgi:sugar lactone lactonase YvrE
MVAARSKAALLVGTVERVRELTRIKLIALAVTLALVGSVSGSPATASGDESHPDMGATTVFTRVPYPGQPFGLLVDEDTVWVTPATGWHQPEVEEWPLWAYDRRTGQEKVEETFRIPAPASALAMGLAGVARDAQGRLYIVDMNGRVLRTTVPSPDGHRAVEVYATIPSQGNGAAYVPWPARVSMPLDLTFDATGNAYVTDPNFPVIWRVPPGGGEAQLWFVDARLQGAPVGTTGGRVAPNGRDLYFGMCMSSSPHHLLQGVVYRLPIDTPDASHMTEVFRSPDSCPFGLAFGTSGKLYVSLFSGNQVVVLRRDGTEERRFPSKEANARQEIPYDVPHLLAFDGNGWLLVANASSFTPNSKNWAILKAFVDDTAAPLAQPSLP